MKRKPDGTRVARPQSKSKSPKATPALGRNEAGANRAGSSDASVASRPPAATYALTLFVGSKQPRPGASCDATWADLVEIIREGLEEERGSKDELPGYSPVRLRPDTSRATRNVEHVSALVLDVDECSDLGALRSALDSFEAPWIVYTSPSDPNPDGTRRVRVLVGIDEPIPGQDAKAVAHSRLLLAECLGLAPGCGAEECLDAARFLYVGRVSGTPARELWSGNDDRPGLDIREFMKVPLTHDWGKRHAKAAAPTPAYRVPQPLKTPRVEAVLRVLLPDWPAAGVEGNRHAKVRALGGWLAGKGWELCEIAALIGALPSDAPQARTKHALECAARVRAWRRAPGWAELTNHYAPETLADLERAASACSADGAKHDIDAARRASLKARAK